MEGLEKKIINESVLDPIHKERCRELFDNKDVMKKEVKQFIIDTLNTFKDSCKIKFNIDKIVIIGSSTGFQYTDTSDIDTTVIAPDLDMESQEYWDVVSILPNGHNVPGTQHPVNFFVRSDIDFDNAENVYDLTEDKWLKKCKKEDSVKVPTSYILEISKFFMNALDLTFAEYERDKREYLEYKTLDPDKIEISEKEKKEVMDRKLVEIKQDLDSLRIGNYVIRGFVHEVYNKVADPFTIHIDIGQSGDPRKSVNNYVYKMLEKYGYRDRIDKTIKEAEDFVAAESQSTEKEDVNGEELKEDVNIAYSDDELKTILEENGYNPDDANLNRIKNGLGKKYFISELDESLESRTEHKMNRIIYKNSGKSTGAGLLAGSLFGLPGLLIAAQLHIDHNENVGDVDAQLADAVKSDSVCSELIDDIKKEVHSDKPDKSRIRHLVSIYGKEVKRVKKEMKKEDASIDYGKVSLKEEFDTDIKKALLEHGYEPSDDNVRRIKNNPEKHKDVFDIGGDING